MKRKVRNLGFSLIELVVAFAILGVATLGIGSLFVVATRSSSKTQEQSSLYNEAQLATNQIENIIQDAELAVSYRIDGTFALQDSNANEKVLYIFNAQTIDKLELILLKWDKTNQEINYREVMNFPTEDEEGNVAVASIPVEPTATEEDWALLAEDVASFSATLDENNHKVFLDIQFTSRRDNYQSSQTITLRNKVAMNPKNISDVTKKITEEMLAEITEVKISMSPQILAPTATGRLDCKVYGKGELPDYTTRWLVAKDASMIYVVGDSERDDYPVQIDEDGYISIDFSDDLYSYTGAFYVKAVVTEKDSGKTIESNVKEFKVVRDMKVSVAGTNHSASLSIPSTSEYQAETGLSYKLQCEVIGNGLSVYDQNVVWSLEDVAAGLDGEVTISADGVLKINNYAIGGNMKVVASLAQNPNIKVAFPLNVRGTHAGKDKLLLQPESIVVSRGEEVRIFVSLQTNTDAYKDTEIEAEDCTWMISSDPWLPSNYLTVGTSGIVSVKEEIPWNQEYEVTVTVTWKKDPTVKGNVTLIIPITTLGR